MTEDAWTLSLALQTAYTYNPDGTAATRTDNNTSSYAFTYTTLGQLQTAVLPTGEGTATYTWQLDGNLATRTWGSSAIAGAYSYDGAKRPIGLYIRLGGAVSASVLARTYDAAGNVTSETQNLAGVRISLNSPLWFAGIRHPVSRVLAAFSEAATAADAGRQLIP